MSGRPLLAPFAIAWLLAGTAAAQPAKPADGLFGNTKLIQIRLELSAKDYEAMQPVGGGFPFPGGPPMPPKPVAPGRDSDRSAFGMEFPWVHATFTGDGTTVENVGLRYKGNSTYMGSSRGVKRPLKVEFDHYAETGRFRGLTTLNLHAGVHDPSKSRETLAYALYREAGVPAPRTAFAEVTLTVPGKFDAEPLGLYTLVEQVNKPFLKAHYKTSAGLLMKPERIRGLDYLGEEWERYKGTYQPKRDATDAEAKRVIAFTKLVNQAPEAEFTRDIAAFLDVDSFLRFMAVTAMLANLDSFFTNGHNYYLYMHPETKKFHFIPWDVDLSMANTPPMFGSFEQQMNLSLTKPYMQCRLADRILAMKGTRERYLGIVKELAATVFAKDQLLKEIETLETAIKEPAARDAKAAAARKDAPPGGPPGMGFGKSPDLRTFVEKRTASVAAQLAGTSTGYEPQMIGFGPPGGFGPGNQLAKPLLDALDGNRDGKVSDAELAAGMKRLFGEWDGDHNGVLDQREIAAGLQKLMPRPGPPGGPGPRP